MSETQNAASAAPAAKSKTEYTPVKMEDGSVFEFAGNRRVDKEYEVDSDSNTVVATFRFRSGSIRRISSADLSPGILLAAVGHGLVQKIGDEWSNSKDLSDEDIVMTCDEMISRLTGGSWNVERAAGDSLAGASIVIRAIIEERAAAGKILSVDQVKAFLQGKLDTAKAKGEKLSRQELYASFRNPASRTGAIIKRLEEEKVSKAAKVDSNALLEEI
jgi:hypothetical protein